MQRFQPDPAHQLIDTNYQKPAAGMGELPDLSQRYPRNPDPLRHCRGRIARGRLSRRRKRSRRLWRSASARSEARWRCRPGYFYHSAGPIYRAAMNGRIDGEARRRRGFEISASTWARPARGPEVVPNVRNATSVMAKQAAGIPHREIVGPGTGGISEKGLPMMTGPGGQGRPAGVHGMHIDAIRSRGPEWIR